MPTATAPPSGPRPNSALRTLHPSSALFIYTTLTLQVLPLLMRSCVIRSSLARRRDTRALAFPLSLAPLAPYAVHHPATVSVSILISHPGLLTPRMHCLLPRTPAARATSLLVR
ncbi:hypothetical protein B0H14DRAFT_3505744 [Mycena olivaceomarginata]|nr:hypothetical protein B0H14DRAFT_3505744 [Mycena olivaceomarginata]